MREAGLRNLLPGRGRHVSVLGLTRPVPCTQGHAGFNRFAHSAGPGIGDWRIGVHFFCNVGLVGLVDLAGLVGLVGLFGLVGLAGLIYPLGKED